MKVILLGEYIKEQRTKLGLTQEQVCAGLCEPVTLSRLENGKQTPGRNRVNAILQRLGLPEDRYFVLLSQNELEIEALKKEAIACSTLKKPTDGLEVLQKLEQLVDPQDNLEKQFILRSKVLLGDLCGRYSNVEKIALLQEAIRLTVPDFDLTEINKHLYSIDELKIINQLGNAYCRAGDNKKAADIFYQLLKYLRKHFQETVISSGMLPMVLYNYSRVLTLSGRYAEAIETTMEGKDACLKYGHYQYLPGCIAVCAECLHFQGDDKKSLRLYRQAYYLFDAIQDERNKKIMHKEILQYFGEDMED